MNTKKKHALRFKKKERSKENNHGHSQLHTASEKRKKQVTFYTTLLSTTAVQFVVFIRFNQLIDEAPLWRYRESRDLFFSCSSLAFFCINEFLFRTNVLRITVIVFSLRITLRCVECDMYCISVLRCVYVGAGGGREGGKGTRGGREGADFADYMWITYR